MAIDVSRQWFSPLLSSVIKNRAESLALTAFAVGQVALTYNHINAWSCPIKAVLGIPCPGCGLSRACALWLHGQWQASLQAHAFAPLFLGAVGLVAVTAVLPNDIRQVVVEKISAFERQTGVAAWLLMGLMLYWCLRLGGVV
jgi:hypothetical protein